MKTTGFEREAFVSFHLPCTPDFQRAINIYAKNFSVVSGITIRNC